MFPHPNRRRRLTLFTVAIAATLTAIGLAAAPLGQAIEYPYPEPPPEQSPTSPTPPSSPTPTSPYPAPSPPATDGGTARVVKRAKNKELGHRILTTTRGRTLYSLSAEKNGNFICTDSACLSLWKPLTVPAGVRPVGPVHLGTIVRPDGRTQVTFRGLPLYRFTGDHKPGDVSGEGFRDIGVWHAAGGKR
jgi:predicted lipoprotein with Yx(FWY)xxD motif